MAGQIADKISEDTFGYRQNIIEIPAGFEQRPVVDTESGIREILGFGQHGGLGVSNLAQFFSLMLYQGVGGHRQPQMQPHSCQYFLYMKGFGNIVDRAELKPVHFCIQFVAAG